MPDARSLNRKHYLGLALCFVGILLVGGSSLITGSGDVSQDAGAAVVGMALIVLAQAVQAAQVTLEDHVLRNLGMAPLTVVGLEGVWGSLFMFALLLPLAQVCIALPSRSMMEGTHLQQAVTHLLPCSICRAETVLASTRTAGTRCT